MQIPVDRFELIEALEGKWVMVPSGECCQVKNGDLCTDVGAFSLHLYSMGQLEVMLKYSKEKENDLCQQQMI
jgi:hypothetical protein